MRHNQNRLIFQRFSAKPGKMPRLACIGDGWALAAVERAGLRRALRSHGVLRRGFFRLAEQEDQDEGDEAESAGDQVGCVVGAG